jgi:hypothetical protein
MGVATNYSLAGSASDGKRDPNDLGILAVRVPPAVELPRSFGRENIVQGFDPAVSDERVFHSLAFPAAGRERHKGVFPSTFSYLFNFEVPPGEDPALVTANSAGSPGSSGALVVDSLGRGIGVKSAVYSNEEILVEPIVRLDELIERATQDLLNQANA